jgi:hypothetical protein
MTLPMSDWLPHRERLRTTLARTIGIAVVAGAVLASRWGGWSRWPIAALLMLWPSFGGHWLELWFLTAVRPRLARRRSVHVVARLATWFAGGMVIGVGMYVTAATLVGRPSLPWTPWTLWWVAGLAMIAIELTAHLLLHLRGAPSFFDGRG